MNDPEDIFVWPDGSFMLRSEYSEEEYRYKGDDYKTLPVGSKEWVEVWEIF